MKLVANRECGECTACCKVLLIDEIDFQKLPGIPCPNCKESAGCQIHDTRPAICRGFHCGWRYFANLGDDWRPDRSGFIIRHQRDHIPPGYLPEGLRFLLFDRTDVILRPGFVEYIGGLIAHRVPVFISLRGPAGFSDGSIFLNEHLAAAVARRDRDTCLQILGAALDALSKNTFEPAVLKHGKSAVSG